MNLYRGLLILTLAALLFPSGRPASAAPAAVGAGAKYEIPVVPGAEEVVLYPADAFSLPDSESARELLPISPVSPIAAATPAGKPGPAKTGEPLSAVVYRKFRLPDQTFDPSRWQLSEQGQRALAEVAELLRRDSRWLFLRVDGYTDQIGSESYNQKLSLERAIFYADFLVVNSGIDPGRVFVRGLGESLPIAGNETPEGRALNRRVEILALVPRPKVQ